MRNYAKVAPTFWTGITGRQLRGDHNAQLVALYLLSGPHANMIGVFHCPVVYIAHDTGMPLEGASKGLRRLCEAGFCTFDESRDLVLVHEMARFQVGDALIEKDKRVAGVQAEFQKIPNGLIKQQFWLRYSESFRLPPLPDFPVSGSPFEGPSEPLRSQEQEQETEQEQNEEQERTISRVLEGDEDAIPTPARKFQMKAEAASFEEAFEAEFWPTYPRKDDKGRARKAFLAVLKSKKATVADLVNGAMRYAAEREGEDPKYTKQPATWLNAEAWLNVAPPTAGTGTRMSAGQTQSRSQSAIAGILSYGMNQEAPYVDGPVIEG